jgi:hypothetical protein
VATNVAMVAWSAVAFLPMGNQFARQCASINVRAYVVAFYLSAGVFIWNGGKLEGGKCGGGSRRPGRICVLASTKLIFELLAEIVHVHLRWKEPALINLRGRGQHMLGRQARHHAVKAIKVGHGAAANTPLLLADKVAVRRGAVEVDGLRITYSTSPKLLPPLPGRSLDRLRILSDCRY